MSKTHRQETPQFFPQKALKPLQLKRQRLHQLLQPPLQQYPQNQPHPVWKPLG